MAVSAPHIDIGVTLARAVFAASTVPLLLMNAEEKVLAASYSFCTSFGVAAVNLVGRRLYELHDKSWDVPRLRAFLSETVAGHTDLGIYEITLDFPTKGRRRLAFHAQKLDYGDEDNNRYLITIVDVTETRRNEQLQKDLIHRNATLLSEVQHRVANSLQIIASILTQSARRVQSQEVRTHLTDAHSRVMSLATLQRHLADHGEGNVALGPYLERLCASLGASMISDQSQITISTQVDPTTVASEVSVSLGLVVTELVINALKHAFPDERRGHVAVTYSVHASGWMLSVSDDGVGMPDDPAKAQPGLGTGIVQALAGQLDATITVSDCSPGTKVILIHDVESDRTLDSAI